ncbi:MAG: hypothetical protein ABJG68_09800 [Crocinitomicaceae bacterium]
MHKKTEYFLEILESLESKTEVIEKIIEEHEKLKKMFIDKGYEILDQSGHIQGNQVFHGEDAIFAEHYYPDVHAMKLGVTTGWVHNMNKPSIMTILKPKIEEILKSKR